MRTNLLCTVGTSLLGHIKKNEHWYSLYKKERIRELARELLDESPDSLVCGAEINSIHEICSRKKIPLQNIILLASDTSDGKSVSKLIKTYFDCNEELNITNIEVSTVAGLQDERPKDFKIQGLRNLVRAIGEYVQRHGGSQRVAIDATGGYKAQIAIAVLMGQALDIPVFYKHERFSEIIDFPPLPIAFDYDLLGKNSALLTDFERGKILSSSEISRLEEKLKSLLVEESANGEVLYELSPIGQIYLTGFRHRNPKPINLFDAGQSKSPPSFGDDHNYPQGFKEFVNKVCKENNWIKTAHSLPYGGQASIKGIGFEVRETGGTYELIATYQDNDNFGARFQLHLTDKSQNALTWAADHLNQKYRPN